MTEHQPLIVTAHLLSPLLGDAPHLDSLMIRVQAKCRKEDSPDVRYDRNSPPPEQGAIPIPVTVKALGLWQVACCSSPILPLPVADGVEYIHKKLAVEYAGLLRPDARTVVATTNTWTKSYRLPLRRRVVNRVVWFAFGDHGKIEQCVRQATAIGKKVADGFGVVSKWTVERTPEDYSWFVPSQNGTTLMRPLPVGDWLPPDLIGFRRDFGAPVPPYWHPSIYTDIVIPA